MKKLILLLILIICSVSACSTATGPDSDTLQDNFLEIYLVRHAEKTKEKPNPGLTREGQLRAQELANLMSKESLNHIHSTNYKRTRDTAAPTADLLGLEISVYDPRDLPAMAKSLLASNGKHLVVGHSNTTPQLVKLLGGDPVSDIDEASEYDRLYKITLTHHAKTQSELIRYGKAYKK